MKFWFASLDDHSGDSIYAFGHTKKEVTDKLVTYLLQNDPETYPNRRRIMEDEVIHTSKVEMGKGYAYGYDYFF